MQLMTTCPPSFDDYVSDYAGHCPCCHRAVLYSTDDDGPVWTCPADLQQGNPHQEDSPDWLTEKMRVRSGCHSNCADDFGKHCEYEHMPLHSACYGGSGTW